MNFINRKSIINLSLLTLFALGLSSCGDDDEVGDLVKVAPSESYSVTVNMKQMVNGAALEMNTSNKPYTNAKGQDFNVTKLQYLISDLTFNKADGSFIKLDNEYHYIDLDDSSTFIFTPTAKVPAGDYTSVSFTFGFDENDNTDGAYRELNIIDWNWPSDPSGMPGNLGGGYHFMRLEGTYLDSTQTSREFKSHMGTARNLSTTPTTFEANHLDITLANSDLTINNDFSFDLVMNIEEWYQNPITWDFEVWNFPIMPIYDAQKALNSNGVDVFTIAK